MTRLPQKPLAELLSEAWSDLLSLQRRQFSMEAFIEELNRVGRGEAFEIHNDARWLQLIAFRDMNVIDLASWTKATYTRGGLLGQIQAHHLALFGREPTFARPDEEEWETEQFALQRAERRRSLFGEDVGMTLRPDDVRRLASVFSARLKDVMDDRHENRAHFFERQGSAQLLDIPAMRSAHDYAFSVIEDLSVLAHGMSFSRQNTVYVDVRVDAEDLVDDVLLPRHARRESIRLSIPRDSIYDALHSAPHDASGEHACFNAPEAVRSALRGLSKTTS